MAAKNKRRLVNLAVVPQSIFGHTPDTPVHAHPYLCRLFSYSPDKEKKGGKMVSYQLEESENLLVNLFFNIHVYNIYFFL